MDANENAKIAEHVAECLERLGIEHAFGIIGAGNVHLFEAIARRGFTEIVCVHHEQAATMAVQTYYRTSGRLAAAILTTGGRVDQRRDGRRLGVGRLNPVHRDSRQRELEVHFPGEPPAHVGGAGL